MRRTFILAVVVCVMLVANVASATIVQGIDIDFVTIGNPGNPGDTRAEANPSGAGAVGYEYQIGKYEVTNGQWDAFVSVAGAPTGNPSNAYDEDALFTGDNVPANNVSWYEASQFCNYLTSGDKSLGAYQLGTDGSITIDRDSAVSAYGIAYVIPTEDEWYKAAYYTGSGYSTYANGTDLAPIAGINTNYGDLDGQPWDVGVGNGTQEQNGTFDMMGNISEWNETLISPSRGFRGGTYAFPALFFRSSFRDFSSPYSEYDSLGFRVASVPEPTTLLLLGLGGLALLRKRR